MTRRRRARRRPSRGRAGSSPVLEVNDLVKTSRSGPGSSSTRSARCRRCRAISFSVGRGETLGLVGESGCGKSTTGRCVLRLIEPTSGSVRFDGADVLTRQGAATARAAAEAADRVPGPVRVAQPADDGAGDHRRADARSTATWKATGVERVKELMALVGLNPEHVNRFPHEFSGGQRQRIGIARALALDPELVVLDEPVSALDVSIQAGVVNLLEDLQERLQLAYVFIAHDLSVVRHISDRVAVMYLGKIVEIGDADDVYEHAGAPVHAGAAVGGAGARPAQGAGAAAGSCSRATCRARRTRRRAAGSAPGAGRRRRSAREEEPALDRPRPGPSRRLPLRRGGRSRLTRDVLAHVVDAPSCRTRAGMAGCAHDATGRARFAREDGSAECSAEHSGGTAEAARARLRPLQSRLHVGVAE